MSQLDGSEELPDADGIASPSKMPSFENSRKVFMSSDLRCVSSFRLKPYSPSSNIECSLLETGHFSDVVLVCGNHAWNVHRSIICKRCAWFEKALTGNFVVSTEIWMVPCKTISDPR